jgi:hypothetical protein
LDNDKWLDSLIDRVAAGKGDPYALAASLLDRLDGTTNVDGAIVKSTT